jgi:hypothetical protein
VLGLDLLIGRKYLTVSMRILGIDLELIYTSNVVAWVKK